MLQERYGSVIPVFNELVESLNPDGSGFGCSRRLEFADGIPIGVTRAEGIESKFYPFKRIDAGGYSTFVTALGESLTYDQSGLLVSSRHLGLFSILPLGKKRLSGDDRWVTTTYYRDSNGVLLQEYSTHGKYVDIITFDGDKKVIYHIDGGSVISKTVKSTGKTPVEYKSEKYFLKEDEVTSVEVIEIKIEDTSDGLALVKYRNGKRGRPMPLTIEKQGDATVYAVMIQTVSDMLAEEYEVSESGVVLSNTRRMPHRFNSVLYQDVSLKR